MKTGHLIIWTVAAVALSTISLRADDATNAAAADATITAPATGAASIDNLKPAMSDDDWRFGLAIPLFAPQINGNVTVAGNQKTANISYNTLKDHLQSVFTAAVEAHKGKYSIYGDVGYMKFSIDSVGPQGHVTSWAGLKFLYANLAGGYQLVNVGDEQRFVLEGTVGVRYWYVSTPLTLSDAHTGDTLFAASKTWDWVDPVLGFRGSQYFTRKLHLDFQGDGGGFNINHSTDWTWSANTTLAYDFTRWFTLSAGYQALALDQAENQARGKNGVNLIFNGVLVKLAFIF